MFNSCDKPRYPESFTASEQNRHLSQRTALNTKLDQNRLVISRLLRKRMVMELFTMDIPWNALPMGNDGEFLFKRKAFENPGIYWQSHTQSASLTETRDPLVIISSIAGNNPKKQKLCSEVYRCCASGECISCKEKFGNPSCIIDLICSADTIRFSITNTKMEEILTTTMNAYGILNPSLHYPESYSTHSERGSSARTSSLSSRSSFSSDRPCTSSLFGNSDSSPREDQIKDDSSFPEHEFQVVRANFDAREVASEEIKPPNWDSPQDVAIYDSNFVLADPRLQNISNHKPSPSSHHKIMSSACEVVPINTFDKKLSSYTRLNIGRGSDEINRVSRESTATPSSEGRTSSAMEEADDPSTERDKSSLSKSSSETSELANPRPAPCRVDKLESLIKDDILRTDPKVADYVYEKLKGRLECASADDLPQYENYSALSLLQVLELQAFGLVSPSEACNSSLHSSSSSSAPSSSSDNNNHKLVHDHPLLSGYGSASGSAARITFSYDQGSNEEAGGTDSSIEPENNGKSASTYNGNPTDPQIQLQNGNAKASSQLNEWQPLRCPYNAMAQTIFSGSNPERGLKYRTCTGPGWSNVQHLKGHLKSHHMKSEAVSTAILCSRCQEKFSDPEELSIHDENIDCPITCPLCFKVFTSKDMRQRHRHEAHSENVKDSIYMEISAVVWKTINDELKVYTDSLKSKGKGKPKNISLETWVDANQPAFEVGRKAKLKANSRLELGQWYIIFEIVSRGKAVPDHPFYDYSITHGDFAEEQILLITTTIMDGNRSKGKLPPADPNQQQAYFIDIFRDAIRIAARTKLSDSRNHLSTPHQESSSPALCGPSTAGIEYEYDMPSSMVNFGHEEMTNMPGLNSNFHEGVPDHNINHSHNEGTGVMESPIVLETVVDPNEMIEGSWMGVPGYSQEPLNLDFDPDLQQHFQDSRAGFRSNSMFPGEWMDERRAG